MLYISVPDINSFLQYQEKSLKSDSKSYCFPSSPLAVSLMIPGIFSFTSEADEVFSADADMHSAQTTFPK